MSYKVIIMAALVAGFGPVASAGVAQPEIIDLGLLPDGRGWRPTAINADGTVVVGTAIGNAVRWTPGRGAELIGVPAWASGSDAMAVSGDGAVIVGDASNAFRWTEDEGFLDLGVLPGYSWSVAKDTNADGSVVVGYCIRDDRHAAYRWTADGGMVDLGALVPDDVVEATGVSADGSIVVGSSWGGSFRWTESGGMEVIEPPMGFAPGLPRDVSDDGRVIALGYRYIWSEDGGYEYLGLADGAHNNEIYAISGDGTTVVGENGYPGPRDDDPLLWRRDIGAVSLPEYLDGLGVNLSGWTMRRATGVSYDGSSVIGWGRIAGVDTGFLVRGLPVPSVCPADLDGDGELTLFDFLAFQNLFDAGDPRADFDGDGDLTIFDFLAFQNAFDAGCP